MPAAGAEAEEDTLDEADGVPVVDTMVIPPDQVQKMIRERALEQLTEDHSLVAELVRRGELSPQEAEAHPQRAVITRALGTDPDVDVDTFVVGARAGDIFLLCSDGLTDMVDEETIVAVVEQHRDDLDRAVKALVAAANKGGGEDNITVVAFEIAELAPDDATAETVRMPAARPDERDDEDTLDETDRVPTVDTMVVPPDEAQRMFERQRAEAVDVERVPERRRWPLLLFLLVVAIVAAYVVWRLLT